METEKTMLEKWQDVMKNKDEKDRELEDIMQETYYKKHEHIKFVLIENLALKSLLVQKNLITVEEFNTAKEAATKILESKVEGQIKEWMKTNPLKVLFDMFKGTEDQRPSEETSEEEAYEK